MMHYKQLIVFSIHEHVLDITEPWNFILRLTNQRISMHHTQPTLCTNTSSAFTRMHHGGVRVLLYPYFQSDQTRTLVLENSQILNFLLTGQSIQASILFSSFQSTILQFMGCGGILIHTGTTNIQYQRFPAYNGGFS